MMKQKIITTLLSLLMLCSFAVVHVDAQEAEKTTPPALAAGFSYSAAELGYGGGDITAICDKIKLNAYMRSLKAGVPQNISREDCNSVLLSSRNMITAEDLAKFEKFKRGGSLS